MLGGPEALNRDITVVVPTIRPREDMLLRALTSVMRQTLKPRSTIIVTDDEGLGAPGNRQRGLEAVETEWVAFLDDDDEFLPRHLEKLMRCAQGTGADYVYPWYHVKGGGDPFPHHFGVPWDPARPHQTTITTLVRTEVAVEVGGFMGPESQRTTDEGHRFGEDYRFTLAVNDAGYKIVHLPERTWIWHHHGKNTSGRPDKW